MDGEVLAELESLKTVNDNLAWWWDALQQTPMQEQAVASEAIDQTIDGRRFDLQVPGDLSVCHAPDDSHEDFFDQLGFLQPVGCAEGLGTEGDTAGLACVPLDTAAVALPGVGCALLERESTG